MRADRALALDHRRHISCNGPRANLVLFAAQARWHRPNNNRSLWACAACITLRLRLSRRAQFVKHRSRAISSIRLPRMRTSHALREHRLRRAAARIWSVSELPEIWVSCQLREERNCKFRLLKVSLTPSAMLGKLWILWLRLNCWRLNVYSTHLDLKDCQFRFF